MKSFNHKTQVYEALEKETERRHAKRDKKSKPAMKVSGSSVKKLNVLIKKRSEQ